MSKLLRGIIVAIAAVLTAGGPVLAQDKPRVAVLPFTTGPTGGPARWATWPPT